MGGKFLKAYDLEDSFKNENNQILIKGKSMSIKVIQIAGFLARRIRCWVSEGDSLSKGQKIGMIQFSSQTTLILPSFVRLAVKKTIGKAKEAKKIRYRQVGKPQ